MAAFDFPASPSNGDTVTVNGLTYSYNSTKTRWEAADSIEVVSDTSPQLGGNLDVNGNDIVSTSNGDIEIDPDGSGVLVLKGNSTKGAGQFKLNCENNSHGIVIKGPPHSAAASYTLTLPNDDGTANQVLSTDGSGVLSWSDVSESDTLDTVTDRGATTTNAVTVGNLTSTGIDDNATSTAITIASGGDVTIDGTDASTSIASPAILNLKAGDANNEYSTLRFATSADGSIGYIGAKATTTGAYPNSVGNLDFGVQNGASSVTAMTISNTGNVGIGTTTATYDLTVVGASNLSTIGTNDAALRFRADGARAMQFYTNSVERARIDSAGTVTVGGTGSGTLQLLGASSGNEGGQLDIKCTGTQGTYSIDAYTDDLRFLNGTTSGNYLFYTNSNAAVGVTVTGTGQIGIGTSGPAFPLDIRAPSGGGDAVVRVHNQHTGSGDDAILRLSIAGNTADSIIQFGDSGDTDIGRIAYHHNGNTMRFIVGAAEEMRLENDGDLHVDGNVVAYSTTVSDERLKNDVQDITGALDTVDALRGVTYTWNAGSREGQRDYGVIAQEVEQVIPEIVHNTTMPLLGDEETVYKTVDYEKLCAVLINAVSELREEVEALKNGPSR